MATISISSRSQQNSSFFDGLRDGLVAFAEGLQEGLIMARSYETLSRMSDEELSKRGLTREGLSQAVVSGRAVR